MDVSYLLLVVFDLIWESFSPFQVRVLVLVILLIRVQLLFFPQPRLTGFFLSEPSFLLSGLLLSEVSLGVLPAALLSTAALSLALVLAVLSVRLVTTKAVVFACLLTIVVDPAWRLR